MRRIRVLGLALAAIAVVGCSAPASAPPVEVTLPIAAPAAASEDQLTHKLLSELCWEMDQNNQILSGIAWHAYYHDHPELARGQVAPGDPAPVEFVADGSMDGSFRRQNCSPVQ